MSLNACTFANYKFSSTCVEGSRWSVKRSFGKLNKRIVIKMKAMELNEYSFYGKDIAYTG